MASQVSIDKGVASQFSDFGNIANPTTNDAVDKNALALEQQKVAQRKAAEDAAKEKQNTSSDQEDVRSAIEIIADFINVAPRSVNFQQHEESEKTIIKVFDNDTQELIRQFPSEEVLEIAKKIVALREDVGRKTGILLDEKI
jgi:flagellar protein FlaG